MWRCSISRPRRGAAVLPRIAVALSKRRSLCRRSAPAAALPRLLQRFGATELQVAITEALDRDVPQPNAVRFSLERRRQERHQPPPIAVDLPPHVQARDLPVSPAPKGACSELKTGDAEASPGRLELYDQLKRSTDE
jgi:hypothetical protein